MKRVLVVVGLVAAVVVPTTLIASGPATGSARPAAQPGIYSVPQVLRAFAAERIPLHRAPDSEQGATSEAFGGDRHHLQITVDVYGPTKVPHNLAYASIQDSGSMGQLPSFKSLGNVNVVWTSSKRASGGDNQRVPAALHRLSKEPAEPYSQLPTIVLHPGASRVMDLAMTAPDTEVDCAFGSADVHQLVKPEPAGFLRVSADSGYDNAGSAVLRWRTIDPGLVAYSCSAGGNSIALEGSVRVRPVVEPTECGSGPRVIRGIDLAATIPHGWFATLAKKSKTLWIGSRPTCARARPDSSEISAAIRLVFPGPVGKGFPDRPFTVPQDPGTQSLVGSYGIYADVFTFGGRIYTFDLELGQHARDAKSIAALRGVLRSISALPR